MSILRRSNCLLIIACLLGSLLTAIASPSTARADTAPPTGGSAGAFTPPSWVSISRVVGDAEGNPGFDAASDPSAWVAWVTVQNYGGGGGSGTCTDGNGSQMSAGAGASPYTVDEDGTTWHIRWYFYCPSGSTLTRWGFTVDRQATATTPSGSYYTGWSEANGLTQAESTGTVAPGQCACGDPVNVATGEFFETTNDLSLASPGGMPSWTRTYGSTMAGRNSPFGFGGSGAWLTHVENADSLYPTVVDEHGAETTFVDSNGYYRPPSYVKHTETFAANDDGTYTWTRKPGDTFTFDSSGKLISRSDKAGDTATLHYDGGLLSSVTFPNGRAYTVGWNDTGTHIISVSTPAGLSVQYGYTGDNLTSVTDPNGNVTRYSYDENHRLVTVTKPRGGQTTNTYDDSGRVVSQVSDITASRQATTTFAYSTDQAGYAVTRETNPDGVVTDFKFLGGVLAEKVVNPDGAHPAETDYQYDPTTLAVTGETDPDGVAWSATDDQDGNVLSRTDSAGNTTSWTYNGDDLALTETRPSGATTSWRYNSNDTLAETDQQVTADKTATTSYNYGDATFPSLPTTVTDARGHDTTFAYSNRGDLASVTDADGNTASFGYDQDGRQISSVTPRGNQPGADPSKFTTTTTYTGDETASVTDSLGHKTTYGWDADHQLHTVTTPGQHTTTTDHDLADEPTTVTDADGHTTTTTYTDSGQVSSQTDGDGNTTSYAYDPATGLETSVTEPGNETTTFTHTLGGRLASATDPDSRTTSYTYSGTGQLANVDYSDPNTPDVAYTYDADGRRSTMIDGTGTTTWHYDDANEVTSVTDGNGNQVTYQHDLDGNTTSIGYPDGGSVQQTFDPANQETGLTDPNGKQFIFGQDPDSNLTSIAYPNTVTDTRTYDNADQLTQITDTTSAPGSGNPTLASFGYDYNATGDRTAQHMRVIGNYDPLYGYDAADRLTSYSSQLTPNAQGSSYSYDAANNMTAQPGGITQTYQASELATATTPTGTTAYTFDKEGDRTAQATTPVTTATTTATTVPDPAKGGWQLNGTSQISNGALSLTTATANQAGSAFWPTALPSGDLHASFTATLNGGSGADGLAFALIDASKDSPTFLGGHGGALGFSGADGAAVELDTYYGGETLKPGSNFVGVFTSTSSNDLGFRVTASQVPDLRTGTHQVQVDTSHNHITVSIDGTQVIDSDIDLPKNVYVGFTAATGGATDNHIVSNVSIASGTSPTAPATTSSYAYDQANHLTGFTAPDGTSTDYTYAGDGLRASKHTGTAPAQAFTWDRTAATPLLLSDSTNDYIYGPDGAPLEQLNTNTKQATYLHTDAQQSVRVLTNSSGAVIGTATYGPYGDTVSTADTKLSPLGYDGQYTDAESGLIYLRARYYDPTTGQFLTRDPAEQLTGQPYQYADGDPLDLADPLGLWWGQGIVHASLTAISRTSAVVSTIASTIGTMCAIAGQLECTGMADSVAIGASLAGLGADLIDQVAVCGKVDGVALALDAAGIADGLVGRQLVDSAKIAADAAGANAVMSIRPRLLNAGFDDAGAAIGGVSIWRSFHLGSHPEDTLP